MHGICSSIRDGMDSYSLGVQNVEDLQMGRPQTSSLSMEWLIWMITLWAERGRRREKFNFGVLFYYALCTPPLLLLSFGKWFGIAGWWWTNGTDAKNINCVTLFNWNKSLGYNVSGFLGTLYAEMDGKLNYHATLCDWGLLFGGIINCERVGLINYAFPATL